MPKKTIIQNIAEHDFHLPMFPDLTRKPGEDLDAFHKRIREGVQQREGEDQDAYEKRLSSAAILVPKKRMPKGQEGEDGYDPGGPGEVEVTPEELAFMRKHRIARRWFGVDLRKGQGLIVKQDDGEPEEEAPKKPSKAA